MKNLSTLSDCGDATRTSVNDVERGRKKKDRNGAHGARDTFVKRYSRARSGGGLVAAQARKTRDISRRGKLTRAPHCTPYTTTDPRSFSAKLNHAVSSKLVTTN